MKKVKLVKKALLPAVIAVCCSLLALTSVSYAWFTLGNSASVESIDVNVTTAEGLQISATGADGSWHSILDVEALKELTTVNQFPAIADDENKGISPVSSAGNVVDGKLELFFGEKKSDILTVTQESEIDNEDGNFIAFDLYVKLDTAETLQLSGNSTVTSEGAYKTESAVRVAFVLLENAGVAANTEEALIWEPNSKTTYAGGSHTSGKVAYQGVSGVDAEAAQGTSNAVLSDVTTFDIENAAATDLFALNAGITKIRVYIWLEGQDVDCVNDVSGNMFSVNLGLEYYREQNN